MNSWRTGAIAAALLLGVAACGGGDEVRSGSGPQANPGGQSERGAADETDRDEGGGGESTTTAEAAAAPTTSAMLSVTGAVTVPDGPPGELSVVVVGRSDGTGSGTVPVVIRNRTSTTLYSPEANGTARAPDGTLAGSGSSQGFAPSTLQPGEWAVGYLYFDSTVPADATFDVTATASDDAEFIGSVDVRPVEINVASSEFGSQIIGIVENPTDEPVEGPIDVLVACFDDTGTTPVSIHSGFTDGDQIPPGGTASFSVDLFDDACANFVVGGSGYDF